VRTGSAIAVAVAIALLLASTVDGGTTRDRPPPAHTGGFGEPTCAQCHFSDPVNSGGGSLVIDAPASYSAAGRYILTITLIHPGARAGGFEMAARFADGTQAGELRSTDTTRTDVTTAGDVQYIHHIYDGTDPVAPDTLRWLVEWTAPERGGAVMFHAAANAADGDDSSLGDFIYVTSLQLSPEKQK